MGEQHDLWVREALDEGKHGNVIIAFGRWVDRAEAAEAERDKYKARLADTNIYSRTCPRCGLSWIGVGKLLIEVCDDCLSCERDRMREALERYPEWVWQQIACIHLCHACGNRKENGHKDDCIWAALLPKPDAPEICERIEDE